eukprot:TRINITY_DN1049_c0_g1_i1.p1 TRINITY_DN1049_c0_g1~~TRINITY_DN1049_c0_g1_i1.p1  ORF type:complete len:265 (-),score=81.37 TRINITY_DN1049_c0_g1_i1:65-829(-)
MSLQSGATLSDGLLRGLAPKRETTEWEDILAKKLGIGQDKDTEERESSIIEVPTVEEAKMQRFADASIEQLREIEQDDKLEDDDSTIVEMYRQKRIEEMKAAAARNKFGEVIDIPGSDFVKEVTEASKNGPVIVHLYKRDNTNCAVLDRAMQDLARRHRYVKLVRVQALQAIPNYPEKNIPTLLVYKNSNPIQQFVGLAGFGGESMNSRDLEWALKQLGVVESELESDPRRQKGVKIRSAMFMSHDDSDSESED